MVYQNAVPKKPDWQGICDDHDCASKKSGNRADILAQGFIDLTPNLRSGLKKWPKGEWKCAFSATRFPARRGVRRNSAQNLKRADIPLACFSRNVMLTPCYR